MLNFFTNLDYLGYIPETGRTSDLYLKAHKESYKDRKLVYGKKYLPYTRIKSGIDQQNFIAQQYCPF